MANENPVTEIYSESITHPDGSKRFFKDKEARRLIEGLNYTPDGRTIIKDANTNLLHTNTFEFDTLEEAQEAVAEGAVPDGATIIVKDGGDNLDTYTKEEIDLMLSKKAVIKKFDSYQDMLDAKEAGTFKSGEYASVNDDENYDSKVAVKAMYEESTAIYSHSIGDFIYLNKHFYKVTIAIAVGDTIEAGTNITSDTGLSVDTPVYVENLPGESEDQNTIIAPVERGTTASRAYSVGEMFIRDGAYCTCIVAIESGGAFALNTNYKAGTVADVIAELRDYLGVETIDVYYFGAITQGASVTIDSSRDYSNALAITILKQNNRNNHYSGFCFVDNGELKFYPITTSDATGIVVRSLWRKIAKREEVI